MSEAFEESGKMTLISKPGIGRNLRQWLAALQELKRRVVYSEMTYVVSYGAAEVAAEFASEMNRMNSYSVCKRFKTQPLRVMFVQDVSYQG